MQTALFTHEDCLNHDPGSGHPESPARLKAVIAALDTDAFTALDRRTAPHASIDQISRMHPRDYVVQVLEHIPKSGAVRLDADTIVSSGSKDAALRAAGAICAAVDAVVTGEVKNAFCAVRPPGHHAEPAIPMGFCIFNNVAIGAAHARAMHGLQRLAVVDFDVHHGNGTQAMFQNDPDLFFASTHQSPLYPGTGAAHEHGCANNIVNAPLAASDGSTAFRQAMSERILPALNEFDPDMIFISAGFDAHTNDPLAGLNFSDADYSWATEQLTKAAANQCGGRLVSTLEGGYDLEALGRCAALHVEALMKA